MNRIKTGLAKIHILKGEISVFVEKSINVSGSITM